MVSLPLVPYCSALEPSKQTNGAADLSSGNQLFLSTGRTAPGISLPISHSRSFDHRFRVLAPLTAIASAFRCPTRRLPRVTPIDQISL